MLALILTACGPGQLLGPTPTPDPCSPELLEPIIKDYASIETRFNDAFNLANNTPRGSLSPQISELQAIRRDANELAEPDCLAVAKVHMIKYMDAIIDGFILFLDADNPDAVVNAKFDEASKELSAYERSLDKAFPTAAP
jgi:hypothetical protein